MTAERDLLAEVTRKFLANSVPTARVRALADKEQAGFERHWWRQGAELGWTSLLVPEEFGGGSVSGRAVADLAVVAEEMGRAVAPGPFLPCNLAALALGADGGRHGDILADIMAGQTVAAWCGPGPMGAERGQGKQPEPRLQAKGGAGGYVINGAISAVEAAVEADSFVVTTVTDGGPTQFVVPADASGLKVKAINSLDLVRRFGQVSFDSVQVPESARIGSEGGAGPEVEYQLMVGAVLACAAMVGATDRAFHLTVDYVFDRSSFGRPLASYQALKHRLADMKLGLEASHATAEAAALAVVRGSAEAQELVSVAKAYIGDRAPEILQECVQLHGGIGVTWDHDLHLYLRRVVLDRGLFGTPRDHRERIAAMMDL
ncbi:MAG: acyl-CoA dehydrogenase family protein [Acidimicrobiales bacterium]